MSEQLHPQPGDGCITCGDVAVEGRVLVAGECEALVETEGGQQRVAIELVAPVEIGDRVLCHAGVALEKLA